MTVPDTGGGGLGPRRSLYLPVLFPKCPDCLRQGASLPPERAWGKVCFSSSVRGLVTEASQPRMISITCGYTSRAFCVGKTAAVRLSCGLTSRRMKPRFSRWARARVTLLLLMWMMSGSLSWVRPGWRQMFRMKRYWLPLRPYEARRLFRYMR